MTAIETFFSAWGMTDDAERQAAITGSFTPEGTYADPRSNGSLTGPQAIHGYVQGFTKNAPGWSATIVRSDQNVDCLRVTVAFGGPGPDGSRVVQHGQYFGDLCEGRLTRLVGFVGTGAPD